MDAKQRLGVSVGYPDFSMVLGAVELVEHRYTGNMGIFFVRPTIDVGWLTAGRCYDVRYVRKDNPDDPLDDLPAAYEWAQAWVPDAMNPFGYSGAADPNGPRSFEHWLVLYRSVEAMQASYRVTGN